MKGNLKQFWCKDPGQTAELCGELFREEKTHVLSQAEAICSNTFVFQDHWEMERTHQPVVFQGTPDWTRIPDQDPEWLYAMNRHTSFLNLAKAWIFTEEARYAQKAAALWEDWIDRVPLTEESSRNTWRSLEAGLRCETWLRSLELFSGSPAFPQEFRTKIDNTLRIHAKYLRTASGDFHRLSNWGVLQDHGLFLLGIYFGEKEDICLALKRLDSQLHMQVMRDGSQWEQSPMYHCEVLHCALDTILIAKKNEISLPERFLSNAWNMCHALADWLKPDGTLFSQSDSDKIDAADLLAEGALLFEDGVLKAAAGRVAPENVWDFGPDVFLNFEAIRAERRQTADTALTDSGNYILRSDFTRDAGYLHMHCGCLGSGHGHGDLLHIDAGIYGEDILLDPGRYTYVDTPLRRALKEPAAHNTTRVDGTDFSVCLDSWGYERLAAPIKGEYAFTRKASYLCGLHLGYFHLPDSVLTERRVVYIKPDLFLIFDQIYAKEKHVLEQNFHLNAGSLHREEDGICWQGKRASARLLALSEGTGIKNHAFLYSEEYNRLEEGQAVTFQREGNGFQSMITLLAAGRTDSIPEVSAKRIPVKTVRSGRLLSDDQAQAVEIRKDGKKYGVIMVFQELISEVDFFCAGHWEGYGKVLVFTPEEPEGICLAW